MASIAEANSLFEIDMELDVLQTLRTSRLKLLTLLPKARAKCCPTVPVQRSYCLCAGSFRTWQLMHGRCR
jgi:hypothetical protein